MTNEQLQKLTDQYRKVTNLKQRLDTNEYQINTVWERVYEKDLRLPYAVNFDNNVQIVLNEARMKSLITYVKALAQDQIRNDKEEFEAL